MANKEHKAGRRKARVEEILIQMEVDGHEATARKDAATLDQLIADDWVSHCSCPLCQPVAEAGRRLSVTDLAEMQPDARRCAPLILSPELLP